MREPKVGTTIRVSTMGGTPVRFKVAEILYDGDDRASRVGGGEPLDRATRWSELLVLRTERGAFAMRVSDITCWQGEQDAEEWHVARDKPAALALLKKALTRLVGDPDIPTVLAEEALTRLGWWDEVAEEV